MTRRQNRSAWIWVAFAAITLASVARAESGLQSARSYTHPVFELFAANHAAHSSDLHGTSAHSSSRQISASRNQLAGAWLVMLPVFFIGLVSPLNQLSARLRLCLGNLPPAPLHPSLFQRPPPQFA